MVKIRNSFVLSLATSVFLLFSLLMLIVKTNSAAHSSPKAIPPYHLSVFARSTHDYTQPDSIAISGDRVFVGFGNGVAKDGSDGKSSTIVEYKMDGMVVRTFSVLGHNDGLRVDPATKLLWALQNEDANPRLAIINPSTGEQKDYSFGPTPHGGGYDDIVFRRGRVFLSASNPTLSGSGVNTHPAIVRAELEGSTVEVSPVLAGDATAIDIPTEERVMLNLTDPDSMTLGPEGELVLDNQDGAELIFVRQPGTDKQTARRLPLFSSQGVTRVDDTVFARAKEGRLLVTDLTADTIYAISSAEFDTEDAYSAAHELGFVGKLDLDNGALTPIVTGLKSPRGMVFVRKETECEKEVTKFDE